MNRSSREPHPLPAEMAALLAAERRAPPPSAARQAHILSRLQAAATASAIATTATAAAVKAAPAVGGTLGGAAATASVAKPLLALALVTSTVGAIGGGMAVHRYRRTKVEPSPVHATTMMVSRASDPRGSISGAPVTPPPGFVAPPMPVSPVGRAAASQPRIPPPSSDIEAEAAVLEHARLSLSAGDSLAALADLQSHARRFPRGVLGEEREALWIRALLRGGERAQAERRAAAFVRRYPESVHAGSVARALREIP